MAHSQRIATHFLRNIPYPYLKPARVREGLFGDNALSLSLLSIELDVGPINGKAFRLKEVSIPGELQLPGGSGGISLRGTVVRSVFGSTTAHSRAINIPL